MSLPMGSTLATSYTTPNGTNLLLHKNAQIYWGIRYGIDVARLFLEALERGIIEIPIDASPTLRQHTLVLDMGRLIGPKSLIPTDGMEPTDLMQFAVRPAHIGPSRVVQIHLGERDCISTLVVGLSQRWTRDPDGRRTYLQNTYTVSTCYVGTQAPAEPWALPPGSEARARALWFWCRHAILFEEQGHTQPWMSTWSSELGRSDALREAGLIVSRRQPRR